MGNKDLERLIRKIVKEAPVDYGDYPERMDPRSQAKIEDPEGLYAKNRFSEVIKINILNVAWFVI